MKFQILILLASLVASLPAAWAKPATTIKIPEAAKFESPTENPWFTRLDLNGDLAFNGTAGFGFAIGHLGNPVFWDINLQFYRTVYGGISVYQPGYSAAWGPNTGNESGRPRGSNDTGYIYDIGPGVGFIYKFFDSESWVEMGRFGINYGAFSDTTNNVNFRGWIINMQAGAGYQLGRVLLSPGISWNQAFMSSKGSDSSGFLSLQWFSLHGSVIIFL